MNEPRYITYDTGTAVYVLDQQMEKDCQRHNSLRSNRGTYAASDPWVVAYWNNAKDWQLEKAAVLCNKLNDAVKVEEEEPELYLFFDRITSGSPCICVSSKRMTKGALAEMEEESKRLPNPNVFCVAEQELRDALDQFGDALDQLGD